MDARADDEPAEPVTAELNSPFSSTTTKKFLTDDEIVSIAYQVLVAGYNTTLNVLAFASYLLALNPEKQDKLCADIDAYYENDEVGIKYLYIFINMRGYNVF